MENQERFYIEKCKKMIESKLKWLPSENWKQRDYEFLLDLIEEKSKIRLSLSTIKRIWNPNFNSTPHLSTLNALAVFLEYGDWATFKKQNLIFNVDNQKNNNIKNNYSLKSFIVYIVIVLFAITIVVFSINFFSLKKAEPKSNFNIKLPDTVLYEVPQNIQFQYQILDTNKADYYIQPENEPNTKYPISKKDSIFKFHYNVPGVNFVKIYENDSLIYQSIIKIFTKEWIAFSQYLDKDRTSTEYLGTNFTENGIMNISSGLLKEKMAEITKNQFVTYYYINDFQGLSGDDFIFETKVKGENLAKVDFPDIFISFICSNYSNFVPLITKDNEYNDIVKFGETKFRASEYNMQQLICNTLEWQTVKVICQNNKIRIYLNGTEAFSNGYFGKSGELSGFVIYFINTGSIDYIRMSDTKNNIVYENNFKVI